jgi:hypothetical protein
MKKAQLFTLNVDMKRKEEIIRIGREEEIKRK